MLLINFQSYLYDPILNININLDECAFIVVADVIRFAIPILRRSAQCPTVSTLCIVKPKIEGGIEVIYTNKKGKRYL